MEQTAIGRALAIQRVTRGPSPLRSGAGGGSGPIIGSSVRPASIGDAALPPPIGGWASVIAGGARGSEEPLDVPEEKSWLPTTAG